MSQVVSLRLPDQEAAQLKRYAWKLRRKTSETARILLGEALRQIEFPYVEFRDSAIGRQAYIKGRCTQVWMLTNGDREALWIRSGQDCRTLGDAG